MVRRDEATLQAVLLTVYELATLRSARGNSSDTLPERISISSKVAECLLSDSAQL